LYAGRLAYIRTTGDKAFPIQWQDAVLWGASVKLVRTVEGSSHSPYLSQPEVTAGFIEGFVHEFQKM
jgi:hypothetical protein